MYNENKKSGFVYNLLCNLLLLAAGIVIIVALCISGNTANINTFNVLMVVGCGIYAVSAVMVLVKSVMTLCGKINHRAPEYKQAVAVTIFMGILFAAAVFALVWAITLL